jgi:hypothetical protein
MANSNGWGDGAANNAIGWGQGANNAIAWGDSHAKSWAGATDIVGLTTDPDAQAFITAAAITDPTQQLAIDNLVKGLKSDNIWTKMKAIYPFVGGTASTHKWNLKDPRDLDAAFRLVFNGGWTHSSNGALPNGTNGYADTKFVPSSVLTLNSNHISYYSRTNANVGTDMGVQSDDVIGRTLYMVARNLLGNLVASITTLDANRISSSNADSTGFYVASRISDTSLKSYKNSSLQATNTTAGISSQANAVLAIGCLAYKQNNLPVTFISYSTKQVAFSSIGDGLNDTEAANLYTRVQAYQTALSRQV